MTKKKEREDSGHPSKLARVTDKQYTDRDSDGSSDKESRKDLERDFLEAKEKYEKKANRAQRIRTENTGVIFVDEDSERQYTNLEREFARRPVRRLRRVKKEKCSPPSQGAASVIYGQSPGMVGLPP